VGVVVSSNSSIKHKLKNFIYFPEELAEVVSLNEKSLLYLFPVLQ
jgi:hypothetical protein